MPDNWTNCVTPYNNVDVTLEILAQYTLHPVLFGGKTSDGSFAALPTVEALGFIATKVSPSFTNLGCPLALAKWRAPTVRRIVELETRSAVNVTP
jgi:hypothetical protein